MISFNIQKPDTAITTALQDKIDNLTKPKGSLGTLEEIALQIGLIQQTLSPVLHHPVNVIYASDHGIADEGVSKSPKEVTRQVIHNFLNGGAGICFLSRQHGFEIKIVDGGVDFDFPAIPELINRKIRKGTRNFLYEAAMTQDEMELAIQYGADIVTDCYDKGSNVISFGEMGIGNTTTSSAVASVLLGKPVEDMTGRGAGLSGEGLVRKINAIKKAIALNNPDRSDAIDVLAKVGGYDIAGMAGVYIGGAALGMPVVMDGFISCVAALVAVKICPQISDYIIASHVSKEPAAHMILKELDKEAVIHAGMCLGEGTGAVTLFPLIDLSCAVYNSMSTFGDINVEQYEELK